MEFGVSFASSFDAVRQARLAEELGYAWVGFYDSPALEPDVWITIANAAQGTSRIHLGPEVLIPHLRHPMVQAAAIATIEQLAPGRLFVGVGTGFTGRMAMGQRPLAWALVRQLVTQIQALLRGERVEIEGAITQMIHPPGFAPRRPIHVPFLIAANGPKGVATARELGTGLIFGGARARVPAGFSMLQLGTGGLLLEDGETARSARVLAAAQIGFALQYHLAYEGFFNPPVSINDMPGGAAWIAGLERIEPGVRHLAVHDGHTVALNDLDAAFIAQHPEALAAYAASVAVTSAQVRTRVDAAAALGATRIGFQSYLGTDWESGLRRYARAVGL